MGPHNDTSWCSEGEKDLKHAAHALDRHAARRRPRFASGAAVQLDSFLRVVACAFLAMMVMPLPQLGVALLAYFREQVHLLFCRLHVRSNVLLMVGVDIRCNSANRA